MASFWLMPRTCMVTRRFPSTSIKSVRIRSWISGAKICKKDTAPYISPMRKRRVSPNSKDEGAIKSFTDRPLAGSQSHSKANFPPSGWRRPCSNASRSLPSSTFAAAPMTLKRFRVSASMRENRARAAWMLSASMVSVTYLLFT